MEDATSENLNNKLEHLAQTPGFDISEVSKLAGLDCSRLPLLFDQRRTGRCNHIASGMQRDSAPSGGRSAGLAYRACKADRKPSFLAFAQHRKHPVWHPVAKPL
jgi:hypothetical protein